MRITLKAANIMNGDLSNPSHYSETPEDVFGGVTLCGPTFRRAVNLGAAKEVDVVLSKRSRKDAFGFDGRGVLYDMEDFGPYGPILMSATRRALRRAHKDGYRYVHFEVKA